MLRNDYFRVLGSSGATAGIAAQNKALAEDTTKLLARVDREERRNDELDARNKVLTKLMCDEHPGQPFCDKPMLAARSTR